MGFFTPPKGYAPADSMTIALATAAGVIVIYNAKIGPAADVQASLPGDPSINASLKKAGWESIALVTAMTLLSKDLNVAILGFGAIVLEHTMYMHAELASPASGRVQASPTAYTEDATGRAVLTIAG
jgi:hypothetical protein